MNKILAIGAVTVFSLIFVSESLSHCQIPCGIYDDEMRFSMISEDIATIEKGMNEIIRLSREKEQNHNQITRWIIAKEKHADSIQETVSQYFLTQKIKPVSEKNQEEYKKYVEKLVTLHKLLVYAMKAKQTTELEYVQKMRENLEKLKESQGS